MLRRPATTLQITSEDVAAYEARRVREAAQAHAEARAAAQQQLHQQREEQGEDAAAMEREDRMRRRRDERIGVGRRG